ncbi:hypothetical protein RHGRI_021129 [Rhododendron griersonianum]|uniref:Endonuclease V n=1 Tax=Rhododendron griersonianum TaxID=479676 RepID=A0AAV6JIZ9_9ERIC|nr:hypothetical protein RHGRI_021129 [Rhododendron griersonianum]
METLERDTGDSKEASSSAEIQNSWVEAQDSLKTRLVTEDDFRWQLPTAAAAAAAAATTAIGGGGECGVLKYVGGVDISFAKDNPSIACGTLVVLDLQTLEVVYEDYSAPILLQLLEKMKTCDHPFYPQVFLCIYFPFNLLSSNSGIVMVFDCEQILMVDGNGILHPRGNSTMFQLHHVDGLTQSTVRQLLETKGTHEDILTLRGDSGRTWGAVKDLM